MENTQVIIIDDDTLAGKAVKDFLAKRGIKSDFFSSPIEGLAAISKKPSQYRLAIIDFQMQEKQGDLVVAEIKQINPKTFTAVISGDNGQQTASKCLQAGADYFYPKVDALEKVLLLCDVALDHKKVKKNEAPYEENKKQIESVLKLKGKSSELAKVAELVQKFSLSNETVMIEGASGTGKEKIATAIHENSNRKSGKFVTINCGAIPENLLESELFGHTKGAFTNAIKDKAGKFLEAHGGTIFLDEIGEMALNLQVKLLRVLQEKEITPVGSNKSTKIDFRVVVATNRDLRKEVDAGRFREDLYYRLNILPIKVPALNDRKEDIQEIANFIINEAASFDRPVSLSGEALMLLENYNWSGNVRQMEGVLKRVCILHLTHSREPVITGDILKRELNCGSKDQDSEFILQTWKTLEDEQKNKQKELLDKALELAGNKKKAAKLLDIPYTSYITKRVSLGLDKKEKVI